MSGVRRPEWPFWMLDRTSEGWTMGIEGWFLYGQACIVGDAVSLTEVLGCGFRQRP